MGHFDLLSWVLSLTQIILHWHSPGDVTSQPSVTARGMFSLSCIIFNFELNFVMFADNAGLFGEPTPSFDTRLLSQ